MAMSSDLHVGGEVLVLHSHYRCVFHVGVVLLLCLFIHSLVINMAAFVAMSSSRLMGGRLPCSGRAATS